MIWVRIDNRLIHGQVIETWLPYIGARLILVANDELAKDDLQREIMSLAIPGNTRSSFAKVDAVSQTLAAAMGPKPMDALVLFSNCPDARRSFDAGFGFDVLNVGNIHYSPGRRQLSPSVAVNERDEECLRYFRKRGVRLDFRCVPNDPVQVKF
ncbi:MAG: PTS sugar transporter subunit IIB [Desulfovibrionaceae bacterium]